MGAWPTGSTPSCSTISPAPRPPPSPDPPASRHRETAFRATKDATRCVWGRMSFLAGRDALRAGAQGRAHEALHVGVDADVAEIGRAHVCTPVTNAHLVCRLLLEKK